jgi:mannan polymerase II complex MNN11 subunit
MHLPYPKRKSSNAQPFLPRGSNPSRYGVGFSIPRRYRSQAFAAAALVLIGLVWLLTRGRDSQNSSRGGSTGMSNHVPSGKPPAVIVTVLDEERFGSRYTGLLKENRRLYAEKHGMLQFILIRLSSGRRSHVGRVGLTDRMCPGYATFFPKVGDYDLKKAPKSWNKVVAMRHALTKFPEATYFWYVDIDTFIMNPALTIERDIMGPANLEEKMIVDHPVVPPDSIIHTFSHLKAEDVHFVVTQDKDGLATNSWLVRNSEWSRFFLDTWFDPTYRSYNFQKAETHALVSQSVFTTEKGKEKINLPNKTTAGAYCSMAPNYPVESGARPSALYQLL